MPNAAPARMPMPAPPTRAPVNPPYSASVAMMLAALRPVGLVSMVVTPEGGAFGSFGFTTTWVEGGGGLGCVWVVTVVLGGGWVCTVVVVCAKAGTAIAV